MRKIIFLIVFIWVVSNLKAQLPIISEQTEFVTEFMEKTNGYIFMKDLSEPTSHYYHIKMTNGLSANHIIGRVNDIIRENPDTYSYMTEWEEKENNIFSVIKLFDKRAFISVAIYEPESKAIILLVTANIY